MRVGQLSESYAVDALRLPFYSSRHPTGSRGWGNLFDLGNPDFTCLFYLFIEDVEKAAEAKAAAEKEEMSAGKTSLVNSEGKINTPQFKQASKEYEGKSSYK